MAYSRPIWTVLVNSNQQQAKIYVWFKWNISRQELEIMNTVSIHQKTQFCPSGASVRDCDTVQIWDSPVGFSQWSQFTLCFCFCLSQDPRLLLSWKLLLAVCMWQVSWSKTFFGNGFQDSFFSEGAMSRLFMIPLPSPFHRSSCVRFEMGTGLWDLHAGLNFWRE